MTPDWVGAELDAAVDGKDLARTELLLALADRDRIPVADFHITRARKYVEREKGVLATLERCAACAADPVECKTPSVFLTRNLDLLTDTRRLRGIAELSEHIGTVAKRAGPAEAVFLLKHVERGTDAAELARVSKVAGKRTREAVELLGLAKAARAVRRLSNLLMTAIGLILALVGQLVVLASPMALRALRRLLVPAS